MSARVKERSFKLVGCDLEYAVENNGHFIPAGQLPIEGTKGHPDRYPSGGIEIDCCAVELTFPPASTKESFIKNIMTHYQFAQERFKDWGNLVTRPSVFFDEAVLHRTRYAMTMGCDPDANAWTGKPNPSPSPAGNIRSFGGHVHIEDGDVDTIKACDLTLGMWSVLHDTDTDRKKLYGRAGAYRPKPYGVEYRVLSNFWCNNEHYIGQVWDLTQMARSIAREVDDIAKTFGGPQEIQDIINANQVFKARNILKGVGFEGVA